MLKKPSQIPHTPGIYLFKKGGQILYIGKAGDLASRLSSYWRKNAGTKVEALLRESTEVEWRELESEIDALIKESELIKRVTPKYNIVLRDDKSYFYVAVTREKFPRIFVSHYPEKNKKFDMRSMYIGPFTSGNTLKAVLRFLRKIFPYCTCAKLHKRPCLNAEIGRCPGYCCVIQKNGGAAGKEEIEYKKNIQNIVAILNGKKTRILSKLKTEMKSAALAQEFERAAKLRNQIYGLENVFLHAPTLDLQKILRTRRNWASIQAVIQSIFETEKEITRVEGYDISNISGTEPTGSMVVFIKGFPKKSEYRKFKIKTVVGPNDFAMMQEVIRRRLEHTEWQYPDIMLIDGGKPQLRAVQEILGGKYAILLAGLAKREEELYIPGRAKPVLLRTFPREVEFFFEHVRNESHRFAKKYHHKLREIFYRNEKAKIQIRKTPR